MFRFTFVAVVLIVVAGNATAGEKIPAVQKVEVLRSTDAGFRWKVTFDRKPKAGEAAAVVKFLKDTSTLIVFDGKETVEIDGKEATVTLGVKGFARSCTSIGKLELAGSAKTAATYKFEVDRLEEGGGSKVGRALAVLDGIQRGHKEGEDDGITVKFAFKKKGDGGTVTLKYSGGIYGK